MFTKLFSPITIRGMKLKNRVVLPAMGTKFVDGSMEVNQQLIDYQAARAKGGCGLNFTEVCSVYGSNATSVYLSIHEDRFVTGLKKLTDAIHKAGGKAGVQLWIPGLGSSSDPNARPLVPSDFQVSPEVTIPGITKEEISEVEKALGKAAKRAVDAGFDCVEFHAAHNYLPHSFLSAGLNHRKDEYGGSLENRMRFLLECIQKIRENIPEDMPVFMRVPAHDDSLENGLTIEEVITFCKAAGEAGVDVLNVSRGNFLTDAVKYEVPPIDIPRGFNVDNAARIRKETGMLTIAVGRINTPELAESILKEEKADMVVIGRGQIADPEFCNKAKAGKAEEIDYCVGCNQGCYDANATPEIPFITCLRNPAVGREAECEIKTTRSPKKVLVIGGGIAGLEAAVTLKKIGHEPILCEASGQLGGQFILAGEAPRKAEMKAAVTAMGEKAVRMGIDVRLNTEVTPDMIREMKPYAVFNCIGAYPLIPQIEGIDQTFVHNSHDVLAGRCNIQGDVVIIGGGMVGLETAEYLAGKGCRITVLEMQDDYCADLGPTRKICVGEAVVRDNIQVVTGVKVSSIGADKVSGIKEEKMEEYPCDAAVIAIGARSRDGSAFEKVCREQMIRYFVIGDACRARRALNATREAFDAAFTFDK